MCYYQGVRWIAGIQFTGGNAGFGKLCLLIGIITAIILGGCSSGQQENAQSLSAPQDNSGSTVTKTPNSEPGPSSTPIPTLPPTPTVVPIPTLEFEDKIEALEFLFDTNHACEFPCWWGIVPGKTKWLAAEDFLRPFTVESEQQKYLEFLDDGAIEHRLVLEVPEAIDQDGLGPITMIEDWWGFVSNISVTTNFAEMGLDINSFLRVYGAPGEVYIYASGGDTSFLGSGSIFTIGLYYQDMGIMMAYFGISEGAAGAGGEIEICASGLIEEFAWLELWDPTQERSFENVAALGLDAGGELVFEKIGDISDLSAVEFYDQMTDDNVRDFCFEVLNPGDME